MLFHFQLSPVADIVPWTTPSRGDEKSLHWFGLTDGCYWLDVGGAELLRYSDPLVEHWAQTYPGEPCGPYVGYQVVRLWEDVLEMLPAVLELVPDDLAAYRRPGGAWGNWSAWERWSERAHAWMDEVNDDSWELFYHATAWWGARRLDTGYLSASPGIWFWNEVDHVHIQWDNRNILLEGIAAWATEAGESGLPEGDFVEEVRSFDARLIYTMAEPVDAVRRDWPHPGVRLNWEGLRQEHRSRSASFANALARSPLQTDWDEVRAALAEVERRNAGMTP